MKKILIEGNGLFYNIPGYKLSIDEIHKRFDDEFEKFSDFLLENQPNSTKTLGIFDHNPCDHIAIYNNDWFWKCIDRFKNDFKSRDWTKNYEEKIGDIVDIALSDMRPNEFDKFKYLYNTIASITLAIIFMYTGSQDESIPEVKGKFDEHFTFNYLQLSYVKSNINDARFLHGIYNNVQSMFNTSHLSLDVSSPEELLIMKNWTNNMFGYEVPALFGKNITQKLQVLEILKEKTIKEFQANYSHESIKDQMVNDTSINYPYYGLKQSLDDICEISIVGVSPTNHKELLSWVNEGSNIIFYYWTEKDIEEIKELSSEFSNLNISIADARDIINIK